jgi:hypothetical protein
MTSEVLGGLLDPEFGSDSHQTEACSPRLGALAPFSIEMATEVSTNSN